MFAGILETQVWLCIDLKHCFYEFSSVDANVLKCIFEVGLRCPDTVQWSIRARQSNSVLNFHFRMYVDVNTWGLLLFW